MWVVKFFMNRYIYTVIRSLLNWVFLQSLTLKYKYYYFNNYDKQFYNAVWPALARIYSLVYLSSWVLLVEGWHSTVCQWNRLLVYITSVCVPLHLDDVLWSCCFHLLFAHKFSYFMFSLLWQINTSCCVC